MENFNNSDEQQISGIEGENLGVKFFRGGKDRLVVPKEYAAEIEVKGYALGAMLQDPDIELKEDDPDIYEIIFPPNKLSLPQINGLISRFTAQKGEEAPEE